jgi:hypothetical protein
MRQSTSTQRLVRARGYVLSDKRSSLTSYYSSCTTPAARRPGATGLRASRITSSAPPTPATSFQTFCGATSSVVSRVATVSSCVNYSWPSVQCLIQSQRSLLVYAPVLLPHWRSIGRQCRRRRLYGFHRLLSVCCVFDVFSVYRWHRLRARWHLLSRAPPSQSRQRQGCILPALGDGKRGRASGEDAESEVGLGSSHCTIPARSLQLCRICPLRSAGTASVYFLMTP